MLIVGRREGSIQSDTTNLLQFQQRGLIDTILLESVLAALNHLRYDALVHSTLRAAFASVILPQATVV